MEAASEILDFIANGGVVVTANSRASRNLRREYAERQKFRQVEAWISAKIFDWTSWLGSLWDEHAFLTDDAPLILSSLQERWIWRRVVELQPESKLVCSADPLASLAQQGYSLLSEYGVHAQRNHPWSTRGEDSVSDPEAFRRWASAFDQACRKRHALSHSELAHLLAVKIPNGCIALPTEVRLVGFDRLTPAQQALVDALRDRGCVVSIATLHTDTSQMRLTVAQNRRDEIATCAEWLRKLLLNQPNLRIAVIVPDVEAVRGEIERTFRRTLTPESMDITTKAAALPFEFSLGTSLATVPVARAALLLLRWVERPLLAEELSWLLLSGFVAVTDTDTFDLGKIDACLRNSGLMQQEISLSTFLGQRRCLATDAGKQLAARLLNLQKMAQGKLRRDALQWAELAQALLNAAGWPGSAKADSVEFQARAKWSTLLESMATLGFDDYSLSYSEFLSILEIAASEAVFAPESHDAQIQILGPAESSGQTFDAVWFLGADETSWPTSGSPHPLLPIALQCAAGMPHATIAADWAHARTATLRISASAPLLIFSYSFQNADGLLRPSALLRELPQHLKAQPAAEFRAELDLETASEVSDHSVKVPDSGDIPWPVEKSPGGFAVLKRQSVCPFQSFAAKRLAASELGEAQWGLSAMQRGELLHLVLERLWSPMADLPSHLHSLDDLLVAIRDQQLGGMLAQHITDVFRKHPATQAEDQWSRAYLQAEKARLHSLLTAWLLYESSRTTFKVEACEKALRDVYVGTLRLDLRVDRVDLVPSDARILIDYKTGEVKTSKWTVPRIEEPQLPLYATYGGLENVQGVVFAQVRAGKMKFVGHVHDATKQLFNTLGGKSPLVSKPLENLMMADWKDDLLDLSNEFVRGEASVTPKKYPETCVHCAFPGLCRVAETEVANNTDDSTYSEPTNGENEKDQSNG
jgi:ATP-dependent helicase/nuclease subunit B